MGDPKVWQTLYNVDPGELWETHSDLKNRLLDFVRRRVGRQIRRRNEPDDAVEAARTVLDPERADDRLRPPVCHVQAGRPVLPPARPAGRADERFAAARAVHLRRQGPSGRRAGQAAHQEDREPAARPRGSPGAIVFIEDYDINVARHLVQGVDVWLNTPRRPKEASGTSGMKAVLNGGLNLSILDGWWAEAYNGKNGFAIGDGRQHVDDEITDARDAQNLLNVLRDEVIPLFYDRDADGLPRQWIEMMVESIATLAPRFSAHRMVLDYVRKCYLVAAGGLSSEMNRR